MCCKPPRAHTLMPVSDATALPGVARQAVERACAEGGIVVAAGGDGTLNAVARARRN